MGTCRRPTLGMWVNSRPAASTLPHGQLSEVLTVGRSGPAPVEAMPDQQGMVGGLRGAQVPRLALRVQSRGGPAPIIALQGPDATGDRSLARFHDSRALPTPRRVGEAGYLPVPRRMPLASSTCRLAAVDW